jgi:4-cresol dehydrogenase (hydroxylating)
MGALPKSTTWQLFKYNFGPYLDGALTHTTLATLSKAGLWLMPAPPHYLPFMVTLPDEVALANAIEALRPLVISGTLPGAIRISHQSFEQAAHGLAAKSGQPPIGTWNVFGALYGTQEIAQLLWGLVREILNSIKGAQIFLDADRANDPVWKVRYGLMRGESASVGSGSDFMRLTCVAPIEGDMAARGWKLLAQASQPARARADRKLPISCEYTLLARSMFLDVHVPYTRARSKGAESAAAVSALADALGAAGFGIADESLELRRVFDRRFAGSRLTRFTQTLATAFGA